eukprot:6036254-Lingulodinium_polyedra.AAC.1
MQQAPGLGSSRACCMDWPVRPGGRSSQGRPCRPMSPIGTVLREGVRWPAPPQFPAGGAELQD